MCVCVDANGVLCVCVCVCADANGVVCVCVCVLILTAICLCFFLMLTASYLCVLQSTKSRKFIKFSPRLRKKPRSAKENAVKAMEGAGATSRELSLQLPNGLNDKEKQGGCGHLGGVLGGGGGGGGDGVVVVVLNFNFFSMSFFFF